MGKSLVVKSAVKSAAPKGMRMSGDFIKALDEMVGRKLDLAAKRAKANGRATMRPADI
jgi:histone H3/H4